MRKPTALVVGGTGPTGPIVVEGLHHRGYEVTIFHSGQHEVELGVPGVEHVHGDPHFKETVDRALGSRTFDLVVVQYGRLRVLADHFKGKAGRVIAIGTALELYAPDSDERWGPIGRPQVVPDTATFFHRGPARPGMDKLRLRMVEAMEAFFDCHPEGTYVGYVLNYGPRQPAAYEWSAIRRILDGRTSMIVADGGIKTDNLLYTVNAAHSVLCVLDNPNVSAGKRYTVADRYAYSMRQRIEFIARYMGAALDIIDLPYELAWPCWPYYRHARHSRLTETASIRRELGYEDAVPADKALAETVDWLLANRPKPGGEEERKLGDPFDYEGEDALVSRWCEAAVSMQEVLKEIPSPGHPYRHPKAPGEGWTSRAGAR